MMDKINKQKNNNDNSENNNNNDNIANMRTVIEFFFRSRILVNSSVR